MVRLGSSGRRDTLSAANPIDHRSRSEAAGQQEDLMSKRARKRRSRKGKAANHGKKPNA